MQGLPALPSEDLQELECHLRDSVERLQTGGLTEEEAFWVARRRAGDADALRIEFGKVNPERVWFTGILWALAGFVLIRTAIWIASQSSWLIALIAHQIAKYGASFRPLNGIGENILAQAHDTETLVVGLIIAAVYCVVLLGLVVWALRPGGEKHLRLLRISAWMSTHAALSAILLGLILLAQSATGTGLLALASCTMTASMLGRLVLWQSCGQIASYLACVFLIALLLARYSPPLKRV